MGQRKSEQLGMPFGTACGRLRKKLLWSLIAKCNMDHCVRCGGKLSEDDFTIEHIKPWLGQSNELFWDIENVAFSHKRCNVPHFPRGPILAEVDKHGRSAGYRSGCRCDECRNWKRQSRKAKG